MEHGIFEVKIEGNLLLVDATGPFNEELIIQYEKALKTCIQSLEASEWNQVITLHQMSRCYDRARIKHNFTTSIHDANEWLATL